MHTGAQCDGINALKSGLTKFAFKNRNSGVCNGYMSGKYVLTVRYSPGEHIWLGFRANVRGIAPGAAPKSGPGRRVDVLRWTGFLALVTH